MDKKLVSIITPVYNASSFIKETIQSVQAQTYENWEMILVDDCSKDNSCEIISKFVEVVVYEPALKEGKFFNSEVIRDLDEFKNMCDVIVSNRLAKELFDVQEKVYTRDLFNRD